MDGRQKTVITVWFVFASLTAAGVEIKIADDRRNLTTQNLGFINIDCGADEDYFDETSGLYYKSDREFISTGDNADVAPEFYLPGGTFGRAPKNLRYFPEGNKNCYTLKPEPGKNNNYLIQVYFGYGDYDRKNLTPKFDLYVGVHYWATVEISVAKALYYTVYHFSPSDYIFVCLLNTGFGIPFISALYLRPLNYSIYRTDSGIADLFQIYDVGYSDDANVRYKDDVYGRVWWKYTSDDWVVVNTTLSSDDFQATADSYRVPSEVLRTVVQPRHSRSLNFSTYCNYYLTYVNVYFYFVEVERTSEGKKREFIITLNEIRGSDLPPILSGFEIVTSHVIDESVSPTSPVDVGAIMAIKQIYSIERSYWQGDPCEPKAFKWDELNCSAYNDTQRVTSLNLGSSKLQGEITPEFSDLQSLRHLDLSNNELIGNVPEFLAKLPNLVSLNLSRNKLNGPLPTLLIEKQRNGTLNLSFDEQMLNSGVVSSHEKNTRDFLNPVVLSITSFSVLLNLVILAILWRVKRPGVAGTGNASSLKPKNCIFTRSEIINMTDNFANIIGEGGFGKVYLGKLNDGSQVAVKLLSQSSKQGLKDFLSEVQLLMMVHHRNLVYLIGYCDDDENMALVYEYMENGNLRLHLSERSSCVLNWGERLQIAVDAAQGLEYLHNGCKPPIVHRDLKTSNILLSENLVAKISDFGLSRVYSTDKDTHVSTNPAGTFGYLDPVFYITGNLTKKSDVYSFGVILFELITSLPVTIRDEEYSTHIVQWLNPIIESGDIQSIVDQRLEGEFDVNSAWKAVEIAMSCVSNIAIERPDMDRVLVELKECLAIEMASGGSQTMSSSMTISNNVLEISSINFDAQDYPRVR